jgi:hypothetical protein
MKEPLIEFLGKSYDQLHKTESFVALAAENEIEEDEDLDYFFLQSRERGVDFTFNGNRILRTIHLKTEDDQDGYEQYSGSIPFGVSFNFSLQQVRTLLGVPETTGGGEKGVSKLFETTPYWDLYDHDKFTFHIQYAEGNKGISLITITSKEVELSF